jgi:hypothetical protein
MISAPMQPLITPAFDQEKAAAEAAKQRFLKQLLDEMHLQEISYPKPLIINPLTGLTLVHQWVSTLSARNLRHAISGKCPINAPDLAGNTPLHYAAWGTDPETVKVLLAAGADPLARNKKGETPLYIATLTALNGAKNRAMIVSTLLEYPYADPKTLPTLVNMPDLQGMRPLHLAAAKGNCEMIYALCEKNPLLIDEQAAINGRPEETPLHFAARNGNPAALFLLLKQHLGTNTDFSPKTSARKMPIDYADKHPHLEHFMQAFSHCVAVNGDTLTWEKLDALYNQFYPHQGPVKPVVEEKHADMEANKENVAPVRSSRMRSGTR